MPSSFYTPALAEPTYHTPQYMQRGYDATYLGLAYSYWGLPSLWVFMDARPIIHFFYTFWCLPYELYTHFFIAVGDLAICPLTFLFFETSPRLCHFCLDFYHRFIYFFGGVGCFGPADAARLRGFFYKHGAHNTYVFTHTLDAALVSFSRTLGVLSSYVLGYFAPYGFFFMHVLPGAFFTDSGSAAPLSYPELSPYNFVHAHHLTAPVYPASTLARGYWNQPVPLSAGLYTQPLVSLVGQLPTSTTLSPLGQLTTPTYGGPSHLAGASALSYLARMASIRPQTEGTLRGWLSLLSF